MQRLARHDLLPDVVRLSDVDETRANLLLSGSAGARVLRGTLKARGRGDGCLLVVGWEGLPDMVRARIRAGSALLREGRGVRLGRTVGLSFGYNVF